MRIIVFQTTDLGAPANQRFLARFRAHFPQAGKRKAGDDWCPVVIHAATEAEAYSKAQGWLDEQLEAERKKAANARAAGDRMRARATSKAEAQP